MRAARATAVAAVWVVVSWGGSIHRSYSLDTVGSGEDDQWRSLSCRPCCARWRPELSLRE
eukprot:1325677-Prymnesium_polylepis.1